VREREKGCIHERERVRGVHTRKGEGKRDRYTDRERKRGRGTREGERGIDTREGERGIEVYGEGERGIRRGRERERYTRGRGKEGYIFGKVERQRGR